MSLMSEWAGGVQPASPTPTPIRASSNCQKFCATPHSAVIADHSARATAISLGRLVVGRSANRAMGMPSTV